MNQLRYVGTFFLFLLAISMFACGNKPNLHFLYPHRIEVSSSHLIHSDSPYFSKALFDHDLSSPWLTEDTLKNGYEYINLHFHYPVQVQNIRILNGFLRKSLSEADKNLCKDWNNWQENKHSWRFRKNNKEVAYPPICLHLDEEYSLAKRLDYTLHFSDNSSLKGSIIVKKNENNQWIDISFLRETRLVERIEIRFNDFFYGKKNHNLAIGELQIIGIAKKNKEEMINHKRFLTWVQKNQDILRAREFIWGKECRLIDRTRYIFGKNGEYAFITGYTYSSMGSEKGEYKMTDQGLDIVYRRYESIDDLNGIFDFTEIRKRLLTIKYISPDELSIQGQSCFFNLK